MWKLANHAAWWMMLGGVTSTAMLGAAIRRALPAGREPDEWTSGGPPAPVLQLRPTPESRRVAAK